MLIAADVHSPVADVPGVGQFSRWVPLTPETVRFTCTGELLVALQVSPGLKTRLAWSTTVHAIDDAVNVPSRQLPPVSHASRTTGPTGSLPAPVGRPTVPVGFAHVWMKLTPLFGAR